MSEDENDTEKSFLSRWSQRKREAKLSDDEVAVPQAEQAQRASPAIAESDADEAFDLSSLPKLEEFTETTDITGFLRKGVPESLRNAALRKSWALDPAIRNYVNPALDYAYDWNTPGGVPGNSELAAGTDIAKMVLRIMGSDSANDMPVVDAPVATALHQNDAPEMIASHPPDDGAPQYSKLNLPVHQVRLSVPNVDTDTFATDEIDAPPSEPIAAQQPARRHGSAMPKV